MTDTVQDKGHGLRFAEQQLKRHGWKHGKGLGRDEKGISEAIKVKVKCNKGGVGHKEGEQFTFHWWDHVFNKASASLQVESHQNGISLKKMTEDDEEDDCVISNKKPRKASLAKAKLYGCFVKSATLLSGQEQPEPTVDSDGSSSDQEEDHKLDLSSATKLSDCELVKACGGRTAHKGARHGLNMSAKLARLEQQEADFMAKYGNKTEDRREGNKPENKRASKEMTEELNNSNISISEPSDIRIKKKKKKKKKSDDREEATCLENGHENHTKKQKKKNGQLTGPELDITPLLEKKKKKKEPQLPVVEEQMNHTESEPLVSEHRVKKKSKKSKKDSNMWEEPQSSPPPKKKKSKE